MINDQRHTYNSFAELIKTVCAPAPELAVNRERFNQSKNEQTSSFYGMAGPIESVCSTLLGGWPEGVEAMRKAGEGLKLPPVPSIRRRVRWSAQGDELDIHAVRNGKLERAWRSAPRQLGAGPGRVHIVVNIGASCAINAATLKWRGAACLALSKALTQAGYNVKISSVWASQGVYEADRAASNGKWQVVLTTAKAYAAPLNVSVLAGLLAHPASFRRIHFHHLVTCATQGKIRSNLGWSKDVSLKQLESLCPQVRSDDSPVVLVPNTLLDANTVSAWLTTAVKQIVPK